MAGAAVDLGIGDVAAVVHQRMNDLAAALGRKRQSVEAGDEEIRLGACQRRRGSPP